MKLRLLELLDRTSPLEVRKHGLLQLCGLTLVFQLLHLTLAWLAVPGLSGLPLWVVWAVSGFFGLMLLGVLIFKARLTVQRPKLELVQQAFLDALWLGVACLAAIFSVRMGFSLGVVLFLTFGFIGYGIGFGRLWFGLSKA